MKSSPQVLKKIHHLLQLMDAESEQVRQAVKQELLGLSEVLEESLIADDLNWDPKQLFWIHDILNQQRQFQIRSGWLAWLNHQDPYRQLESGFAALAELQGDFQVSHPLPYLLDDLCDRFLSVEANPSALNLNRFLFQDGLLSGSKVQYYDPAHSHLPNVIVSGKGLPLSLAVIFMLVGYRLDLEIHGLNMPGHFLARTGEGSHLKVFDCFNRGKVLTQNEVANLAVAPQIPFDELLEQPPTAAEILMRALMNLIHAYRKAGQHQQFQFMQELLADLYKHLKTQKEDTAQTPQAKGIPQLGCGQLVRHKKYGYRGVVVDFDLTCQATDTWYRKNLTHPTKNQPWYHVFVDGSDSTTYAAESNLEADVEKSKIDHPLVPIYFERFENGHYFRNQVPWKLELP